MRSLGVSPDRIVYAHCCKMPRDIDHAARVGVSVTTFDTEAELHKVAKHHPSVGLVLRIRADDPAARCNLGDKYGAEEDEVMPLLTTAKARLGWRPETDVVVSLTQTNPFASFRPLPPSPPCRRSA